MHQGGSVGPERKLWQLFEVLMVIVSELIVPGLREETRTAGSYRQRHDLMERIYPRPRRNVSRRGA